MIVPVARRKRQRRAPAPPPNPPNRLSQIIIGLIFASLILGALGFYANSQSEGELAQTVFGAQTLLDIPTSPPPTRRATISPEEEGVSILTEPTIEIGRASCRERV